MKSFENELRSALTRRNPPEGFSERVISAIGRRRPHAYRRWLGAAAVLVLMLASVFEHERRQRIEARTASEELVRAMEIVNAKLDSARQRVIETGAIQ
jgi:hypothetical protein